MVVNPTDAKEVALEWLKLKGDKPTPPVMSRLIYQIKGLMENGFEKDDIMYTIKHVLQVKPDVYSFGYIEASINDVLRQRDALKQAQQAKEQVAKQIEAVPIVAIDGESEVESSDETTERNRRKAERINAKSRERTKHYFHLFERQREDN